ncbi:unnamed protein product [Rotaria sp. Silwood1]|nr:unnamed protein product [Rotaria sp. Silwood1]
MLEQLLDENALARCTIVFTYCKIKDINRAKRIEANRDPQRVVSMLVKAHSIIFADMDTFENDDSDVETRNRINQSQAKRRQHFMEQLLQQIDNTDDSSDLRILDPDYYRFETHVLFDDAFEDDENGNRIPNRYVKQLVATVNVAGAYEKFIFIKKKKINLLKLI